MNPALLESFPGYIRQPNWRWNVVMAYQADPGLSEAYVIRDPVLFNAVRFYRMFRGDNLNGSQKYTIVSRMFPEVLEAFVIYHNGSNGCGYRWALEAAVMTGESSEEIAKLFPFNGGAKTVETYVKMFFDVRDYLKSEMSLISSVLASSLSRDVDTSDYDFTWKSAAFYNGMDGLRALVRCRAGGRLTQKMRAWMREVINDRYLYRTYTLSSNMKKEYVEQSLALYSAVQTHWRIEDGKELVDDSDTVPKQFLEAVRMIVENPVNKPKPSDVISPVENSAGYDYSLLERVGLPVPNTPKKPELV